MTLSHFFSAQTWFSVGPRRRPTGSLRWVITPFAAVLAVFVIAAATVVIVSPWTLTVLFFSGISAIGFLTTGAFAHSRVEKPTLPDWILSAASVATGLYFAINAEAVVQRIALFDPLSRWDIFFASLAFLLTIEVTRRTTGLGLMVLVLIFVGYNLWGHLLGGVMHHGFIDFEHFLDINVFTTDGIFGLPLRVAATYAFLFVLFGTLLQAVGGGDFFFNFAAAISGHTPGGPAKVAVMSSGLYGMVSGSPTSDVVTTGSITIPIMKRLGYKGSVAGAIEVAASTGGSLVTPVMGSAAFIMVDFTGIDYRDIALAALLPAILYYISVYAQVHFSALKWGMKCLDDDQIPKLMPTLKEGGLFLIPLVVLTVALLMGYTPTMVAVFGSVAVFAVATLRAKTRIGPLGLIHVLSETCYRMVPVAGACAAAGLVIGGITMTGLAAKFAHLIYGITDAQMFPTLLLAAGLTIILGLGMPTPSAYILAAALLGSLMEQMGIPTLPGHMFLLYYAVLSALTPPVAVAAYAAASIADDNPLHIAVLAVKFALAAFIIPFAFIYGPELLLVGAPGLDTVIAFVTAACGLIVLAAALEGHAWCPLYWWERLLACAGAIALLHPSWQVDAGGVLLASAALARSYAAGRGGAKSVAPGGKGN